MFVLYSLDPESGARTKKKSIPPEEGENVVDDRDDVEQRGNPVANPILSVPIICSGGTVASRSERE